MPAPRRDAVVRGAAWAAARALDEISTGAVSDSPPTPRRTTKTPFRVDVVSKLPDPAKNPLGRPVFQRLQYSDQPSLPLVPLEFKVARAEPGKRHRYRVIAVNTCGLQSSPSAEAFVEEGAAGRFGAGLTVRRRCRSPRRG